jgi:hypothetical protein
VDYGYENDGMGWEKLGALFSACMPRVVDAVGRVSRVSSLVLRSIHRVQHFTQTQWFMHCGARQVRGVVYVWFHDRWFGWVGGVRGVGMRIGDGVHVGVRWDRRIGRRN